MSAGIQQPERKNMKVNIKNRHTGAVLFECDVPSSVKSSMAVRYALRRALDSNADLRSANLRGSNLSGSNLSGLDLSGSDLRGSNLSGSNLSGLDLSGSDLRSANLSGSDLSGSNLRGSDLSGSNLSNADLSGSNLRNTELSGSNLRNADLRSANLSGSNLSGSDLSGSNLSNSNLRNAELSGSNLSGSNLSGSDLSGSDNKPLPRASIAEAIENLDKVRAIILDNKARLSMDEWHGSTGWFHRTCAEETVCGTAHCLAGWLQVCSIHPEIKTINAELAGILCAPVAAKMFFKEADQVINWLEKREYAKQSERAA